MAKKNSATTSQPLPKTNPALERLGILAGDVGLIKANVFSGLMGAPLQ